MVVGIMYKPTSWIGPIKVALCAVFSSVSETSVQVPTMGEGGEGIYLRRSKGKGDPREPL